MGDIIYLAEAKIPMTITTDASIVFKNLFLIFLFIFFNKTSSSHFLLLFICCFSPKSSPSLLFPKLNKSSSILLHRYSLIISFFSISSSTIFISSSLA